MFRCDLFNANSINEIKANLSRILSEKYIDLFPSDQNARILIKPNLNSNMNALTGNTTDLRLLSAIIEFLKKQGYKNITIGEGTNSGFYRNRISVISRLMIDNLASYYGITVKDLNYSEPVHIDFENGVKAGIASECLVSDMIINMPKLKTHFEAGMSVCLKNLIGCLVGQENKKKTHASLASNILNINKAVKPSLHIVDAIVSMEGLGPTRGTPLKTGTVFIGTDPYLIDLLCARFASFDYRNVRTLLEAEKKGLIDNNHHEFVRNFGLDKIFRFKPPKAGPVANFIHSPKRQKYFLAIRNTPFFNYACSTKLGGKLLYMTGLRQDVFIEDELNLKHLAVNSKCSKCNKCSEYCPLGADLPGQLHEIQEKCIHCLYCFLICPEKAIEFEGTLGFVEEQIRQYDEITRRMA